MKQSLYRLESVKQFWTLLKISIFCTCYFFYEINTKRKKIPHWHSLAQALMMNHIWRKKLCACFVHVCSTIKSNPQSLPSPPSYICKPTLLTASQRDGMISHCLLQSEEHTALSPIGLSDAWQCSTSSYSFIQPALCLLLSHLEAPNRQGEWMNG